MTLLHSFCRARFFVCGFSFLKFLRFKYIIKSFKNEGIFAFFASFISYSYLILFPVAFNTIMDCPGKTLSSWSWGKMVYISPWSKILVIEFLVSILVFKFSLSGWKNTLLFILRGFIMNGCWIYFNAFSESFAVI